MEWSQWSASMFSRLGTAPGKETESLFHPAHAPARTSQVLLPGGANVRRERRR